MPNLWMVQLGDILSFVGEIELVVLSFGALYVFSF